MSKAKLTWVTQRVDPRKVKAIMEGLRLALIAGAHRHQNIARFIEKALEKEGYEIVRKSENLYNQSMENSDQKVEKRS